MTAPIWVTEFADAFWRRAGGARSYPRDLRGPILRALPLAIVPIPGLRTDAVWRWLRRQGVSCAVPVADRALRGCLVAHGGGGFAFLDADDPADEQRFSLAHELAHFLREVWHPRAVAVARLGPRIVDVFDGRRPPTSEERLHALLRNVPVGPHVHLLARDEGGRFASTRVTAAERDADRLAFELLAPADAVLARSSERSKVARLLRTAFGLPAAQAAEYADLLVPAAPSADELVRRLRGSR